MCEVPGQMSLFDEEIEYTHMCDRCMKVWTSYAPFPKDWECPTCVAEEKRILET